MKRFLAFFIPGVLAVGLAVTAVLLLDSREQLQQERAQSENTVKNVSYRIEEDLYDMESTLSKLSAAASPRQSVLLLGEVWRLSGSAAASLSLLPESHADTYEMNQFIVRCGDYAYSLMGKVLRGRSLSSEDMEQLSAMEKQCGALAKKSNEAIAAGSFPSTALGEGDYYEEAEAEGEKSEESITDYPTLIYDGPFSESAENQTPLGVSGQKINAGKALLKVQKLFPGSSVTEEGYCSGALHTFSFTASTKELGEVSVSVTEQGGAILYFMGSPSGTKSDPPSDEETKKLHGAAEAFLQEMGYGEMEPSYAQYYSGCAVLNYAALQEGVILYSDLIKVYVDRDSLQVYGMDARNYCFNHRERKIEKASLSEEDARNQVNGGVAIETVKLALIPLTQSTEVLCYECKGEKNGRFYIVYINAQTGEEEQIFEVINSEEGDLVV